MCEQTLWYDRLSSLKSVDEMIGSIFDSLNSRGILQKRLAALEKARKALAEKRGAARNVG